MQLAHVFLALTDIQWLPAGQQDNLKMGLKERGNIYYQWSGIYVSAEESLLKNMAFALFLWKTRLEKNFDGLRCISFIFLMRRRGENLAESSTILATTRISPSWTKESWR